MNPLLHIRKAVFKVKQTEFAAIARVGQASVSRWENGECSPSLDDMRLIREEAFKREIEWDDRYFFAMPEVASE
ncbi:helix-turn-helix transcriptional regulator [Devosia sp. 2618]|uniref:helix-turn-helix domain-containing protein n=1 Tax=Devosia sp. 2618 TaxID=3156454 RepID=UPI00339B63FF